MKKVLYSVVLLCTLTAAIFAAGSQQASPLVFVWYPNESGEDLKGARDAMAAVIEKATGRKVEHRLTTDYNIAIEAIANNKAHLGFFGAQGYIEANKKNPKVQPLVVNSGASGTLKDAMYYSWICVRLGEEGAYRSGSGFSLDNIQGKKFSWVSTSSTSGFKVPSNSIVNYFSKKPQWTNLKADMLLEGGPDKFFSEVLFGNSHQGSAVNLLTKRADVAVFCDTCVYNYVELVSGTENRPGAVYQVRKDAADPFTGLVGEKFVVIQATPVLNAPMVVNTGLVSQEEIKKLLAELQSDATTKNELIFVPKGAPQKGLFKAGERFIAVQDSWFQPIRDLNN
ncbi:MAG: phosphate/phosphite/phosphonate ABC transporter substrate-binding protein [Treponemataceae bacterium]|nr:phosphate/phosphite/phosphonate ABC transporter substrate-binding protein [Treponemataceae bacterium]